MPQITLQGEDDCAASYVIRDWCYKAKVDVNWEQKDLSVPQVLLEDGTRLVNPTIAALAEAVGFRVEPRRRHYDTVIVGAGPAGLSAAIYAGSEGLETLLLEKYHVGGQAGSTSFIENMLGYADGVSGCDFAADAIRHVTRFPKIDLVTPMAAKLIGPTRAGYNVFLSNDSYIWTRTLVIATGVSYRYLDVPGAETFRNRGVYYGASLAEANRYRGKAVTIVGGGNSAGQAAVHFALYARKVTIVARRASLAETMSDYLVQKIQETPNIYVKSSYEVARVSGSDRVTSVTLRSTQNNERVKSSTDAVFIFIGGRPHTDWMHHFVALSPDGYILPGEDAAYATSKPGVFAIGDVRYGSLKRVVTAAGDGASVVNLLHRYLAETSEVSK
jgi:thioredoxin reductase (NADPH)